jgi:hypothetical protein
MRSGFFCSLIVLTLASVYPASAASNISRVGRNYYETCSCHFGYPGGACVPQVACLSEGGRCEATCKSSPQSSDVPRTQ